MFASMFRSPWMPLIVFDGEGGGDGGGEGGNGGGSGGGRDSGAEARIRELNDRAKAEKDRADAAEQKLRERDEADASELDKAKNAAEREKARADQAEARATKAERSAVAREAARRAGFIDPADAEYRLGDLTSEDFDSDEKIETAVKTMAEKAEERGIKHLLRAEGDEEPPSAGGRKPGFGHLGGEGGAPAGGEVKPDGEGDDAERDAARQGIGRDLLAGLTGKPRPK